MSDQEMTATGTGERPTGDSAPMLTRVAVLGQGYVGLPLAIRAVEVGYDVVGFDTDDAKVMALRLGTSYVEDVAADRLKRALATGRYRPSVLKADIEGFDVAVITVPTPLRDGKPDLSHIAEAAESLAPFLTAGSTVVLESTSYPGTTEGFLAAQLFEHTQMVAGTDYYLGYSPERIDPGNVTFGLANTTKLISGIGNDSLERVRGFYDSLVERTVAVSRPREAELAKLIENTFRHVNIALVNELAMVAAELDIDIWEALDAAATKPFGYMRFAPGPGVGGHCLPIDPSYLSWHVQKALGRSFRFVELANDINAHMPDYVVHRVLLGMNQRGKAVSECRILLLGLAYKADTSDIRESPAIEVARKLTRLGADVRYIDSHVDSSRLPADLAGMSPEEFSPAQLARADVVVVLVAHSDLDYQAVAEHARYVFDTRRCCNGLDVEYL